MTIPAQPPSQGFLYVAFGRRYVLEAAGSARSLRQFNPGAHVTVITDQQVTDQVFDTVIQTEPPAMSKKGNYHVKIAGMRRSPYERTLFIDTDTLIAGDLMELFPLMDRFDLLVTPNAWRVDRAFEEQSEPYRSVPRPFMSCNTGFIGFAARPVVRELFEQWSDRMDKQITEHQETNDQPPFRWALYHSTARFSVLSNAHNYQAYNPCMLPAYQPLVVLHDRRPFMAWYADFINKAGMRRPRIIGHLSPRLVAAHAGYITAGLMRTMRTVLMRWWDRR